MSGKKQNPEEIEVGIDKIQEAFSRLQLVVQGWAEGAQKLADAGTRTITMRVPAFSYDRHGVDLWKRGPRDPYSSGCDRFRFSCDDLDEIIAFLTAYCEYLASQESEST